MRRWELAIELDAKRSQPLFLQLASAIAEDIRKGRLKPGEALPGTRALAECLAVNRNTVIAGYDELVAEGLVNTRVGGGTFVVEPMREAFASPSTSAGVPTYSLASSLPPPIRAGTPAPGTLMMSVGLPDARLFPAREFARAFRRAIERRGGVSLSHADCSGHIRLRRELAAMLSSSRGLYATPENLMITRSIEQAIDLVARILIAPGDTVVVEAFGYPPAWSVLKLAGARLLPLPVDAGGLDVDALELLLARQSIRAVFLTPHHQFPTASVMPPSRRARLAELALAHRFAIIEDDYDHEFHYEGKPILPIAAGPGRANVIYIGSLSNLLAPGISSAFIVAPAPVFEHLLSLRAASDARGDAAVECAVAELLEDGELLRHVRRMRRIHVARRDALAAALTRRLGSALAFRVPQGGMGLWARIDEDIDSDAWARAGESEGVLFWNARRYDFLQRETAFMRLGFCYHDETEIEQAVQRMAQALKRIRAARVTLADRAKPAPGPEQRPAMPSARLDRNPSAA